MGLIVVKGSITGKFYLLVGFFLAQMNCILERAKCLNSIGTWNWPKRFLIDY